MTRARIDPTLREFVKLHPQVEAVLQHVGIPHRHLQQVVEVVRDAGGKLAHGFHLVRTHHPLFAGAHLLEGLAQPCLALTERRRRAISSGDQVAADEPNHRKDE